MNKFQSKLADTDWSFLYNINSANDCYNAFSRHLTPIYNQSFPIKVVDESPHPSKPWFSKGLLTSCKRKNSLYKQYVINPTPQNKSKYKKFRNKYNFLVKLARKKYFHEKLASVTTNLKQTWSVIKQVISKKKTEHLQLGTMKDSNGTYTDPSEIATKFNNFFINIGPNLANSIPPPQLSHKQFLVSHYTSSFLLSPTSTLEVSSVVSSLKNSRSEGADGLYILPIKESINMLASPLSHIF